MTTLLRALLLLAALLLTSPAPAAAACWCHPLYPAPDYPLPLCADAWKVLQGGLFGFTTVFQGAPVPSDLVAQTLVPPVCPEPSCHFTLARDGADCAPLATPAATVLWKTPELGMHLHARAAKVRAELTQVRGMVAFFCSQSDPRLRSLCSLYQRLEGGLVLLLVSATLAAMDPPNPVYAQFPPLGTQVIGPPLTLADVTYQGVVGLTQAQIDAVNAWLAQLTVEINLADQHHAIWEAASGAVLAHQAGDPLAMTWIGLHTRKWDVVKAQVLTARVLERFLRTEAISLLGPDVQFLLDGFPDAIVLDNELSPVSLLDSVGLAGTVPPLPNITILEPNGGEVWQTGTVRQIRWTSVGLPGKVRVYKIVNGVQTLWLSAIANTGVKNVTVFAVPPGASVRLRLSANPQGEDIATDKSDAPFTITP